VAGYAGAFNGLNYSIYNIQLYGLLLIFLFILS